jgi:hypothetical protein
MCVILKLHIVVMSDGRPCVYRLWPRAYRFFRFLNLVSLIFGVTLVRHVPLLAQNSNTITEHKPQAGLESAQQ